MKIINHQIHDILIINIQEKEANLANSERFKELIFAEIDKGAKKIIISFEAVEYVDSSFLGAMVAILKRLMTADGKMVIIALNNDIKHLFDLTRLDKVFTVEPDLEKAKQHF